MHLLPYLQAAGWAAFGVAGEAAGEVAGEAAGEAAFGTAGALAADLELEPICPSPEILAKDILEAKVLNVLNSKPINFFL